MSDRAHTIHQVHRSDIRPELRDIGNTALRFWRRTLWVFAIAVVSLAMAYVNEPEPDAHGFFVGLLITIAVFPPAISAGLEAGSKWDGSRAGVLLLSAAIVSFVLIVANGFWFPYLNRGDSSQLERFSLGSSDHFPIHTMRVFSQPELLRVRDQLIASRRAIHDELRALDSGRARRARTDELQKEALLKEMLLLEQQSENHRTKIGWAIWLHQLRTALALLPLFSVGLGFMVGRWATLLRPGLRRQLFTWSFGLPVLWSTGYTLATATEHSRVAPPFEELAGSAFAELLIAPAVMLIVLAGLWLLVRPHVRATSTA